MPNSIVLLFFRLAGFFLISPLFAHKGIPKSIRFGAAIVCTLVLAPPFSVRYTVPSSEILSLLMLREIAIGYLMGFFFALLFEAAAFAGQLVGTVMGFSVTELFDAQEMTSQPLLAKLFSLVAFLLFFALDLHHPLLRILYGSFDAISFDAVAQTINNGVSLLFRQAIEFSTLPLTILISLLVLFAVLSRFLPIFWLGFPLQLFVGFLALAAGFGLFIPLVEKGFSQFLTLLKNLVVHF